MKLVLLAIAAIAMFAAMPARAQWTQSPGNFQVNGDLDVKGDATFGDDVTVTDTVSAADLTASDDVTAGDDLVVTDDATVGGLVTTTPASVTSTAGLALTIGAGSVILLNADAQGLPVITNTVAAPSAAGQWAMLVNVGTSNSVMIAEGTTVDSGGNKTLAPEDVMLLVSPNTSAFNAIYHDN